MTVVGFVGLGLDGLPMAKNLVARGFEVRGFDVRPAAMDRLGEMGGTRAPTLAAAAEGADVLVLMVVNAAQARLIFFAGGALDALPQNAVVALMATCPPGAVEAIAARVAAAGRRFVDAPVSGGVVGAELATSTIMAAGARDAFETAKSVLDAIGDKVFHVGEMGEGAMAQMLRSSCAAFTSPSSPRHSHWPARSASIST